MKPIELKDKLHGVFNLTMTPFHKNGELNEEGLKANLRNLVKNCKGQDMVILSLGTTGEFYTMSEKENLRVAEIVVNEINGEFPVLIGSARAGTRNTIEASKAVQSVGADGVLIVHPYYAMPTEEEVMNHYKAVADELDIGVVVYNNSATSKLWLGPNSIAELSKVENIIGLKENTNNPMSYLSMMKKLDPKDISIFCGLGHVMYQFMCFHGCSGYVTEISNFAPELCFDLYKAGEAHDIEGIRKAVETMDMIWEFIDKVAARRTKIPSVLTPAQTPHVMPFYQAVFKACMDIMGIPGGYVRAPMSNLTDDERKELKDVLTRMGLLK